MLTYTELLKNRRSVRQYKENDISSETIKEILHEACLAPSSCNTQPWRFIVITDKTMIKKISDESKKSLIADIEANPNSEYLQGEARLRNPNFNVFYNAPCLILVVGENNYSWFTHDCTLCVSYLMFAAATRNLGTCWIGLGNHIRNNKLRAEIGLPNGYEVVASVILGQPVSIPTATPRNDPIILKML